MLYEGAGPERWRLVHFDSGETRSYRELADVEHALERLRRQCGTA
jgi:hypothetical protein